MTIRTPELAAAVCELLATGESLRSICRREGFPSPAAIRRWALEDADFSAQSARAHELGCHAMADECLEIGDDARNDWMAANGADDAGYRANGETVQRSRLRIDTRMRLLGKWLPKVYGERVAIDATVTTKRAAADYSDAELAAIVAANTTGGVSVPENGRSDTD